MRIWKTLCTGISIAAFGLLTGCGSSEELMQSSRPYSFQKDSRFIDGMIIPGNFNELKTDISGSKVKNNEPSNTSKETPAVKFLQQKYAALMDVTPKYIKSVKLYTFIEDWYGVGYRMGGHDKSGIDCSAFVQQLYDNVFHINLVRTSFDQYNAVTYVWQKDNLREGDLVFFRTRGKHITHVGVYLMNSFFVHASTTGVMISSLKEEYWSRRFAGAGYINDINKLKS